MMEALETVRYVIETGLCAWRCKNIIFFVLFNRNGVMSINQAAIHFNLPYSSLYGRFKRCKFEVGLQELDQSSDNSVSERLH